MSERSERALMKTRIRATTKLTLFHLITFVLPHSLPPAPLKCASLRSAQGDNQAHFAVSHAQGHMRAVQRARVQQRAKARQRGSCDSDVEGLGGEVEQVPGKFEEPRQGVDFGGERAKRASLDEDENKSHYQLHSFCSLAPPCSI